MINEELLNTLVIYGAFSIIFTGCLLVIYTIVDDIFAWWSGRKR
jgi:hypothetical protein